jgi:hypothetical protein
MRQELEKAIMKWEKFKGDEGLKHQGTFFNKKDIIPLYEGEDFDDDLRESLKAKEVEWQKFAYEVANDHAYDSRTYYYDKRDEGFLYLNVPIGLELERTKDDAAKLKSFLRNRSRNGMFETDKKDIIELLDNDLVRANLAITVLKNSKDIFHCRENDTIEWIKY